MGVQHGASRVTTQTLYHISLGEVQPIKKSITPDMQ